MSKENTGGGEGIEVLVNDPFNKTTYAPDDPLTTKYGTYTTGQYTHKIYHLARFVEFFFNLIFFPCIFYF